MGKCVPNPSKFAQSDHDSAHPELWHGLVSAYYPGLGHTDGSDILWDFGPAHNHMNILSGTPEIRMTDSGLGLYMWNGSAVYYETPNQPRLRRQFEYSFVARVTPVSQSQNWESVFARAQYAPGMYTKVNGGSTWGNFHGGVRAANSGTTVGKEHHLACTWWTNSSSNVTLTQYLDNKIDGSHSYVQGTTANPFVMGSDVGGLGGGFGGQNIITEMYVYDRELSAGDIDRLFNEPGGPMIKRRRFFTYFGQAGAEESSTLDWNVYLPSSVTSRKKPRAVQY